MAKNRLTPVYKTTADKKPFTTLDNKKNYSGKHVFTVIEKRGSFYYVNVPVRPNGTRGFIKDTDVTVYKHDYAIYVDRKAFNLVLYKNGVEQLSAKVAIGQDKWPTPAGAFFTREFYKPKTATTPYGTGAFGLSGYSNVLTQFGRGDGQIAIHGTNQPELLGSKASHGCIRIPNDALSKMAAQLPLGVPVIVV